MFASHTLLVQEQLKDMLTADLMRGLRDSIQRDEKREETDLSMSSLLENLVVRKTNTTGSTAVAATSEPLHQEQRDQSASHHLADEFRRFMRSLQGDGNKSEILRRYCCPACQSWPLQAYVTSCMHIYCHECMPSITDSAGNIECKECDVRVENTEFCGSIDVINLNVTPSSTDPTASTSKVARVPGPSQKKRNPKQPKTGKTKNTRRGEAPTEDWIAAVGREMHGAKLAATRTCIREWFANSSDTKVLIFTQFLDMVRILGFMCESEQWGFKTVCILSPRSIGRKLIHSKLIGKMSVAARESAMADFNENPDIRILISSLGVGGTGLDLTIANKCILLDLWWNEAVEQQVRRHLFFFIRIILIRAQTGILAGVQNWSEERRRNRQGSS